jgi:UDP-GlcNAc:undecaprenyl-phosphate/decaprenyl-phosphate GlcNAc-1-phosphate transferase
LAFNNELFALITALTVVGILLVFRLFGHAEAVLVKERLVALGTSFFHSSKNGRTQELEVRLQGDADWNELWRTLTARAASLNLSQIRLDVNAPSLHEGYHARWDRLAREQEAPHTWRAEVPLTAQGVALGKLEIAGPTDDEPVWLKLAALGELIEVFEHARAAKAAAPPPEPDEIVAPLETPRLHRNGGPPVVRLNTALDR